MFYRLLDAVSIILGLYIAARWATWTETKHYLLAGTASMLIFGFIAELSGIYRSWRGVSAKREILSALFAWGVTLLLLTAIAFTIKPTELFSRFAIGLWFVVTPLLMVAGRTATRETLRITRLLGYNQRQFAIVGVNELAFQLAQNIEQSPQMGLRFAGFFDDRAEERTPEIPANLGQRVGNLDDLFAAARDGSIDRIYITFPMRAEERIRGVLSRLSDTTASVYLVPDFFVFELLHCRWTDILGLPVVSLFETPFYGIDGMAKRICDFILGSAAVLALAIPMAIIAVWIKTTSAGPIFFRQRRYGLDGREIRVWKFRTMSVCEDGPQAVQATKGDSRVTPVGAILRRTSLDELPQLFNVVEGTMSLVGPRPHPNALNEQYRTRVDGYMLRHKVKPGITGYAQVNGWRGETDTPEKMEKRIEYDLRYIRDWSLWLDVKILFKTVFVVFSQKNAY